MIDKDKILEEMVKDPYGIRVQYASIEAGIEAVAIKNWNQRT